jgi:hypothetical protein
MKKMILTLAAVLAGGSTMAEVIQFGGATNSINLSEWQTQINADQIIQWNGVNSSGGSFGSQGSLNGAGTGATLWSSNKVLTLTSRSISSTLAAGTNTFSTGSPNILGITGGDNAKFDVANSEAWTFDFDQDVTLKYIIVSAVDGPVDMPTFSVAGGTSFAMNTGASEAAAVTWDPTTKRYVWTFAGGGLDVSAGTDITLSAATGGAWGLQGIVVDVIPEPATLGLVTAFGATILFVRRRLVL